MMAKQVWESKSGEKWSSQEEADRHDAIDAAELELRLAADRASMLLGKTGKTADGELIECCRGWKTYWRIARGYDQRPRLARVELWGYDVRVRADAHNSGLVFYVPTGEAGKWTTVRADECYADGAKAHAALVKETREWLEIQKQELEKLASGA